MKRKSCQGGILNQCKRGLCCTKIINLGVTLNRVEILRDVNLHIHCGDLTAIIGPNGAGKTTLFKAILGEIPHTGRFEFTDAKNDRLGKPVIGYVPQKLDFDRSSPTSVMDLFASAYTWRPVWLGISPKVKERIKKNLEIVQAEHLMSSRLGDLSGGELQRVLLALALDPMPNLLLLDEPVSGVDQAGLMMFYQTVSKLREDYDLSIILISHDLDLVREYADHVAYLDDKTVECCGTAAEVFNNADVKRRFGGNWTKGLTIASQEDSSIMRKEELK